jgi:hypothetical protein
MQISCLPSQLSHLFFFTGIEKQYFKKLEQVEACDTPRSTWDSISETHKHEVKFSFPINASSSCRFKHNELPFQQQTT